MFKFKWFEAGNEGSGGSGQSEKQPEDLTYENWLEKQDDTIKGLLDEHVKGLKSALGSERESRKEMEKQLREMAKKAEAGSEAQTKLTQMADQIQTADRRAEFYDEAHRAGVVNLKLAYLAATQEELFDRNGRVNFDEMKKNYPELFGKTNLPAGNAGAGTGDQNAAMDMNAKIRRASGRQ